MFTYYHDFDTDHTSGSYVVTDAWLGLKLQGELLIGGMVWVTLVNITFGKWLV